MSPVSSQQTLDSRSAAIRAAAPAVAGRSGFALLKSSFSKMLADDALCEEVAARAAVDAGELRAIGSLSLHAGITQAAAEIVHRAALVLAPVVVVVTAAERELRGAVVATQEELLGRTATNAEKDNFRTRAATRLLTSAVRIASAEPHLLSDAEALEAALVAQTRAALATPEEDEWGVSWVSQQRRANGAGRVIASMDADQTREWSELYRVARPQALAFARRLGGSPAEGDDLFQEASLRVFGVGATLNEKDLTRALFLSIRQVNYERRENEHRGGSLDIALQGGAERDELTEIEAPSYRAWAEGFSDIQSSEARLDARAELGEVIRMESETSRQGRRAEVAAELARIAMAALSGQETGVWSRADLIRRLLPVTGESDTVRARAIVVSTLASVRRPATARA